jgi:glycine betaine/proline transport system substrate-binding protein
MRRTILSRVLALGVSAAALGVMPMAAMAQDMPGEGTTVRMGQATWDTGWFHAEIYKQFKARRRSTTHPSTSRWRRAISTCG